MFALYGGDGRGITAALLIKACGPRCASW